MSETNKIDASMFGLPPLPSHSPDTIAALLWAREVLQEHQKKTYAVQDPKGIEELKSINIGGVDQWLHIRGRNRSNPILLYIHGGPGAGLIGFMDPIQRAWEDYFTVVQWDQRLAGKSYYPATSEEAPLTIEQYINDAEEVIPYLLSHLRQEKLVVVGHSWGTALGMHIVKRHPEWLHAYVGVGQVTNSTESERLMHERLMNHAKEQQEDELVAQLEAIAPYPDPDCLVESYLENRVFIRRELTRLAGEGIGHHMSWDDAFSIWSFRNLISPHLTLTDLSNSVLSDASARTWNPSTTEEQLSKDLPNDVGSSFDIPIFFFTGRHDYQTSVPLSDQWFFEISAPYKELVHFEESAHGVINEEPGKFLVSLVNKVLPFAQSESSDKQ